MVAMRLYHNLLGAHVHCRLFVGEYPGGKAGDLIFRQEEWDDVHERLVRAGVDVRPEGDLSEAVRPS